MQLGREKFAVKALRRFFLCLTMITIFKTSQRLSGIKKALTALSNVS